MKKIFTIALLSLSFITYPALARYYWPTFTYPDKELLLKLNNLNSNGCPTGQVKLTNHSTVNLNQCNSDGSCPSNWEWIGNSDEKCHDLSEIEFLGYKVSHIPDERYYDYSIVTASYGSNKTGEMYFKYVMTTPPGEYWYCTREIFETGMIVMCANDF